MKIEQLVQKIERGSCIVPVPFPPQKKMVNIVYDVMYINVILVRSD
jgi:hypothetical protein